MTPLHYCVIGIEMGMTSASSITILATFSTADILETFIDMPNNNNNNNMDLQNSMDLN